MLEDSSLKIIDISVNLSDPMFCGIYRNKKMHEEDIGSVLQRAKEMCVEKMILHGLDFEEGLDNLDLVKEYTNSGFRLYVALGVHPSSCQEYLKNLSPEAYIQKLREVLIINLGRVVALGDCGLDYFHRENLQKNVQLNYLEKQIEVAGEFNLPLFFYERQTDGEFIDFIKTHRHKFSTGVVGPFLGTLEQAHQLLEMDLFISISGSSLETEKGIEVVSQLPLDRILIGTDSPLGEFNITNKSYGLLLKSLMKYESAPVNTSQIRKMNDFVKGCMVKFRNEPCCAIYIIHVLAELHGKPLKEIADTIYHTSEKIFFSKSKEFY